MEKLTKAIAFAAEKHEGQTRKGSDTPTWKEYFTLVYKTFVEGKA